MQSHSHSQLKHHIPQPLFKLTTSSGVCNSPLTSSSYFASPNGNKSASHGHQLNIRPVNSLSSSYFRPSTPRQKEKENEKVEKERAQSAERIQSLHTRLHQEAEKIRKWKTSTEIEIKEKEKKLQEAMQTIDSQRKSILDLQFQNESLSSKLQEELAGREEVEHKIICTRDMCNALKDHAAKVEDNLLKGEADRDELRFEEKKRIEQFQELVVKFQDLQIEHTSKYNEMENKLDEQKMAHGHFVLKSTEKLEKAESQIQMLENERKAKESHISTMKAALEKSKEESSSLEHQLGNWSDENHRSSLQQKLSKLESAINSHEAKLQITEEMLRLSKGECTKIEEEFKATQSQLEDSQQEKKKIKCEIVKLKEEQKEVLDELEEHISSLLSSKETMEKSLKTLTDLKETAEEKMQDLQLKLESVTREKVKVDSLNDHITKEKHELERAYADLQTGLSKEIERTSAKEEIIRESNEKLAQLQDVKSCLAKDLHEANKTKEEMDDKIRLLTLGLEGKQRTISDLEGKVYNANYNRKYLEENLQDIKTKLEEEIKEKEELQASLEDYKVSETKLRGQITALQEKMAVLENNLANASKRGQESQETIQKLQEEHRNLKEQYDKIKEDIILQNEERLSTLEMEKDHTRLLKDELEEKNKNLETLEEKIRSLQDQLSAKTKQGKEVQQENKVLKSKVTSHTKQADKFENQRSKLSSELTSCKDQIKELREKLKTIKEELTEKSKELEKVEEQVKGIKEEKDKAVQEKEDIQNSSEKQMTELCATLEKYKLENEKIVAQKERELELLRANALKESQEQYKKQLEEAKNQIERLENEVKRLKTKQIPTSLSLPSSEVKQLASKIMTPQVSAVVPETPKQPRGILKQNDSSQKKRRVAFAGSGEPHSSSSEDNEEGVSNLTKVGNKEPHVDIKGCNEKGDGKSTPRVNVRFSPKPSHWRGEHSRESKSPFTEIQKLKQIPRGRPIAQQNQKKLKIQSEESEELTKFKELFPDMKSPDSLYDKSPERARGVHQTMKPPFKSKITKIRPLSRRKEKQESISWFDSDSLFGFDVDE
ncbi:synaptonemal complex protein 1-like [Montipora foliosa]|uniref:synaptonemal complex protein 1-like n=1 Tax=Montipora foliosa TaxID=591990 RepID=UPI0035F103B3